MSIIAIPYGAYWCTPFARWQGTLAHLHSLSFAARVARDALVARDIALTEFDYGVLGLTVPQRHSFYGLPWLAGEMGAAHIGGPTVMQACATGARVLGQAGQEIASGAAGCALAITTGRVSNGPHLPFALNDIIFARETGAELETMNNYGCSLIWGHPQAPTGMRAIIELSEELALLGGGYGLFHGCAAGDTAMAVVLRVH